MIEARTISVSVKWELSQDEAQVIATRLRQYAADMCHDLDPENCELPVITSEIECCCCE